MHKNHHVLSTWIYIETKFRKKANHAIASACLVF